MKQTILVTGGTGFIGSHTTVELQEAGYEVVIIDNLSNSNANVVDGIEKITCIRPAFEKVDCCDFEALEGVFKKYPKIEGIIHFAAYKAVGESVEKPLLYYRNNLTSLINLLELMPKYDVKGILFKLYRLWPALKRASARYRGCTYPEGHEPLRQHQADQRGDYPGLYPLWRAY